jgi:aminobenzoyl-glutamate transport protein
VRPGLEALAAREERGTRYPRDLVGWRRPTVPHMEIPAMSESTTVDPAPSGGFLDKIERLGNKVPHPVIMFLYLIIGVAVISAVLAAFDVSVTEEVAVPVPIDQLQQLQGELGGSVVAYDLELGQVVDIPEYVIREQTFDVQSLLSIDGVRFMLSSFVNNFAGFAVVAVTFVAMAGVGVAEKAGMMAALIRKLVAVAPAGLIAFFIIFVGVLSSVASDAGYLILIPLAATAFYTLGRHPLAGMAAAYAGVGAIFAVNVLITPVDSMLNEITNEAIGTGGEPLTITANLYFSIASSFLMAVVAVVVTQRVVEPRLGTYDQSEGDPAWVGSGGPEAASGGGADDDDAVDAEAEALGLKYAFRAMLVMLGLITLATAPPGAPLRDPVTDAIIGNTPFMASLIFLITLIFLVCGVAYGRGASTITSSADVIDGVTKTFAGLAGLVFMLLMIAQFIAFFNYTNIPRVLAVELAGVLESAGLGALPAAHRVDPGPLFVREPRRSPRAPRSHRHPARVLRLVPRTGPRRHVPRHLADQGLHRDAAARAGVRPRTTRTCVRRRSSRWRSARRRT